MHSNDENFAGRKLVLFMHTSPSMDLPRVLTGHRLVTPCTTQMKSEKNYSLKTRTSLYFTIIIKRTRSAANIPVSLFVNKAARPRYR